MDISYTIIGYALTAVSRKKGGGLSSFSYL
jgi:hypothetical protein